MTRHQVIYSLKSVAMAVIILVLVQPQQVFGQTKSIDRQDDTADQVGIMTDYMNDITTTATPRRDPNRMNNMEMGDMDMGAMTFIKTGLAILTASLVVAFTLSLQSVILLRKWVTYDEKSMGLACLYVVLFAMGYEGLKVFRDFIYLQDTKLRKHKTNGKYVYILNGGNGAGGIMCSPQLILLHVLQTILHIVQAFMSLILMLIIMTFNVYLCIAAVGGSGLGYLFVGWMRTKGSNSEDICN